ncbi:MAG: CHAT domain-containing protein [Coleofasciculaceae cyanobacterium]
MKDYFVSVRFKHLGLFAVVLLLSLTPLLQLPGTSWKISRVLAQESTTQDRKVEAERLYREGIEQFNRGQFREALQIFQEALVIVRKIGELQDEGKILNNLGVIYRRLGEYSEALTAYQSALVIYRKLGNRLDEGVTLSNIGLIYERLGQYYQALTYYQQALAIHEKFNNRSAEGVTLRNIGTVYYRLGQHDKALEFYKQASDICINFGDCNASAQGSVLINTLGQKIEECQKTQCQEKSQLLDQREVIAAEFEENVRSLEQEIRSRRANDPAFLNPSSIGGSAEEIVSAQPGTVLIYPLVLEDKLWILWASQGGITKSIEVPQVGLKQLSETVVKFRQLLQNPGSNINELQATGKQLHDWLIPESLQKELKDNQIQNLVFSLDHVTRYIPLSTVFDGEKYLIENYNISTIISAGLTRMGERLPPGIENTSVLALGLSEAKYGFNPLPNVPAEIDAIVRQSATDSLGIYPGLELLNNDFNRQTLRDNLASHLILHIATHGEFVPGSNYDSYLLLGDGEKLPIADIQNFRDLGRVHLVVLSACETALGETGQDGTEIAGLSYYFLDRGAKAVMASLWQVNDESTRLLMEKFYHYLATSTTDSPMSKTQALRQAQLSMLRGEIIETENTEVRAIPKLRPGHNSSISMATSGFSHPYYWAPFILIGNGL